MRSILWGLVTALCLAGPAHAGPIGAAFSAIASVFTASSVALTLGKLALTLVISAYQKRRMKKKLAAQQVGIKTQFTGTGGTTPLSVIVGRYATGGHLEAPQASQPAGSSPPQKYLTYIIGLGDVPGMTLTNRVVINDAWHTFSPTPTPGLEDYGVTVEGELNGLCWFRFHDGSQTTADAFLLDKFGLDPERPWSASNIGRGIPYVVATFARDQERFPGEPRLRFEVNGIPLYDPRFDSTVGGSGPQRWDDRATWAFTENPKVIEYNIRRGITVDGFGVWGGDARAEDLPLDNWFAAMNACDLAVDDGQGGTEPAFRFGFEISLDQTPADVIDEINRSCVGETVEIAGVYKTRVGTVGLPVYFFTDGDVIVTRAQELAPFPSLDATFNALTCSVPDPELLWEAREAPPLTNPAWEAEDGLITFDAGLGTFVNRPRRLLRQMTLPAVRSLRQAQRVMASEAAKSRRQISHGLTLPPAALVLEPLDAVAWTSSFNGYDGKIFEVTLVADAVDVLRPRVGLIEADPADDTPPVYVPLATPSSRNPQLAPVSVVGFAASAIVLADATGAARRPGALLEWNGPALRDLRGIAWEVRVTATGQAAAQGSTQQVEDGQALVAGLLPSTAYQARAQAISDRPAVWTAWVDFVTGDELVTKADLAANLTVQEIGGTENIVSLTVTNAVTTYDGYGGIVVVTADVPDKWVGHVMVRMTLTASNPVPILWRAVVDPPGPGAVLVIEERADLLIPGVAQVLRINQPVDTALTSFSFRLEVSGQTLGAGESVLIDRTMLRMTFTDL